MIYFRIMYIRANSVIISRRFPRIIINSVFSFFYYSQGFLQLMNKMMMMDLIAVCNNGEWLLYYLYKVGFFDQNLLEI